MIKQVSSPKRRRSRQRERESHTQLKTERENLINRMGVVVVENIENNLKRSRVELIRISFCLTTSFEGQWLIGGFY